MYTNSHVRRHISTQRFRHACTHTHTVGVIWWSLLQTRQCCVVLTNSSVSLLRIWFKLTPVSHRLEAFETLHTGKEKVTGTLRDQVKMVKSKFEL